MKHRTAKFIDLMILKPVAFFYSPVIILYGLFSNNGSWLHIFIGLLGFTVSCMIGGSLYPKATPEDIASGRAWDDIGPDNEKHGLAIDIDMRQIKIKHNNASFK